MKQYHGLVFSLTERPEGTRPLGAHRIAHYLRENNFDIEVVDWVNWWPLDSLKQLFRQRYNSKTVFVGFSHMFSQWTDTLELFCEWIKTTYPHVHIISGSSVRPLFDSKQIDYYVQGYGEYAVIHLLKWLLENGPRPIFDFPAPRGKKIINAIDNYAAFPMRNLTVSYEDRDFIQSNEWLTIELSRGCMFKCKFCNYPVLGVKDDYSRDALDFQTNVQDIYDRYGVKHFTLADETVNDRMEKLSKFANAVENLNFEPYFTGFVRADLMISNPAQMDEMLRMKLLGHFYGVETFNTKSGKIVGKGMPGPKIKQGLLDSKQYFQQHSDYYTGTVAFILGLPYESKQSLNDTKQWLLDYWQGMSYFVNTMMIQNSEMYKPTDISLDYKKYGYREMLLTSEHEPLIRAIEEFRPGIRKILTDGNNFIWENDYMNFLEATQILGDFYQTRREDNFHVGNFIMGYRIKGDTSLKSRLAARRRNWADFVDKDIQWYIDRKLNV